MGLRMEDIHNPTVPSSDLSDKHSKNGSFGSTKTEFEELQTQEKRLESELSALGSVLDSHHVTMSTPLTTFDGYPRPDIDVALIRTTRARIIHLRNDYKSISTRLADMMMQYHQQLLADMGRPVEGWNPDTPRIVLTSNTPYARPCSPHTHSPPPSSHAGGEPHSNQPPAQALPIHSSADTSLADTPFARVNSVADGSPAEEAGLKAGDRIRRVGNVNWINHEDLRKVGELVQREQGRKIAVKVLRTVDGERSATQELELQLTPRVGWGGRGSLGCHLVPL